MVRNHSYKQMESAMNKRKNKRVDVDDLTVDVSDGIGFCSGSAKDISKFGMCLVDMAKKLGTDAENLTVVISGKNRRFKMKVKPKWQEEDGLSKKIGAEIDNAPWEWTEFVLDLDDDDEEKDVWGNRGEK